MLEQLIRAFLASNGVVLPDITLATVAPNGRVDVALSNMLALVCQSYPLTSAMFGATRPIVDGFLVSQFGPARMKERLVPVVGKKNADALIESALSGVSPKGDRGGDQSWL